MNLTRVVDWSIFAMVAIVVSAGVRIISAANAKCPKCDHPKNAHFRLGIDAVPVGPLQCSICNQQCD